MSGPIIRLAGEKQLRKALKEAGEDLSRLKELHATIARLVISRAKIPRRTGRLASTVRAAGTLSLAIVRAGRAATPYAPAVHWGWPRRKIPRNDFLVKAARASERSWLGLYYDEINHIIERLEYKTKGIDI